ncbi:MAG: DNA polymerase III subunit delta, partial [Candidatus Nealsonbacteria bacterium]|nr:DNA polymerase III subunit delta [Candidatus Nealsonbacteria bacterium]
LVLVKDLLERKTQYPLIAKIANLHPFVVKKAWEACRSFSLAELKKIYQKIFQADLDAKTGRMEPEVALDLLLASI